jgi:hypothetical protein
MSGPHDALAAEARYFHRALFGTAVPAEVVERYIEANLRCLPEQVGPEAILCRRIVEEQLDAEAIEFVLRLRRGRTLLTSKIQILSYLVEVRAAYYDYFVARESGRARVWLHLAGSCMKTAWKYGKGSYLVRRLRV